MTAFWKIVAPVTCVAVICGAVIGGLVYKKIANQRKLADEVSSYRVLAEKGDANAELQLGHMYYYGQGVPRDYGQAFGWYSKAADQGDAKAQYAVGYMYYYGKNVAQDYSQALSWWEKAANQNYAGAECVIGEMYYFGKGTPRDYTQALNWYRKASDQNYARAEDNLGAMYYNGEGVPRDYVEAFRWFHKAADQGHAKAQYNVGFMYSYGRGTPQNHMEANRWFSKAAASGNKDAQRALRTPLSTSNKVFIAIQLLGGVLFLFFPPRRGRRFNLQQPVMLAGLLVLLCAGLDLYWYSHIEILRATSIITPLYFCKHICVGMTIAMLFFVVRPWQRSANVLLRISIALLLVFDIYIIARHQVNNSAQTAQRFYSINGLLIGVVIISAIFYGIAYKRIERYCGSTWG